MLETGIPSDEIEAALQVSSDDLPKIDASLKKITSFNEAVLQLHERSGTDDEGPILLRMIELASSLEGAVHAYKLTKKGSLNRTAAIRKAAAFFINP